MAGQAAPATLKSAFLDPVSDSMSTEVALQLFAKTDAEFMQMFAGMRHVLLTEIRSPALPARQNIPLPDWPTGHTAQMLLTCTLHGYHPQCAYYRVTLLLGWYGWLTTFTAAVCGAVCSCWCAGCAARQA